jgi:hypothetical protein
MCKYACGAKYNMLMFHDKTRQANEVATKAQKIYATKAASLKGLKGNEYKVARNKIEPFRQRNIKAQASK